MKYGFFLAAIVATHITTTSVALCDDTAKPAKGWTQNLLHDGPLAEFQPVANWHGVAKVEAEPGKPGLLSDGEGKILINATDKQTKAPYLLTKSRYGDARVELEFMIPKGSNAGVYMMGRYEVQILDGFGKTKVGSGDLGGIYQRWDPARGKGKEGFEGIAPKVNAAKAPGEWQTMKIIFRAPLFDEAGKKTADASFEKVLVNGVLVQENATTTGPTRSSPLEGEEALGPIAIQGDHGPIAIRNFRVTSLDKGDQSRFTELDAYWAEVSRAVNEGDFGAYSATCHPEGILVSGSKNHSQPLASALVRWKKDFTETREGKVKSRVEFRFSKRVGDATTAHETGIFCYTSQQPGGEPKRDYVHLEALLVKRDGAWKILMENQIGPATEAEWLAFVP